MVDVDAQATKDAAEAIFTELRDNWIKSPFRFFYSNGDGNDGYGSTWCTSIVMNCDDNNLHVLNYQVDGDVLNANTPYSCGYFLKNGIAQALIAPSAWYNTPFYIKSVPNNDSYVPPSSFSNIREVREGLLGALLHIQINL